MRSAFPVRTDATVAQMVISTKTSATARQCVDTEAFPGDTSTERDVWTCTPITYTLSTDASPNVSSLSIASLHLLAGLRQNMHYILQLKRQQHQLILCPKTWARHVLQAVNVVILWQCVRMASAHAQPLTTQKTTLVVRVSSSTKMNYLFDVLAGNCFVFQGWRFHWCSRVIRVTFVSTQMQHVSTTFALAILRFSWGTAFVVYLTPPSSTFVNLFIFSFYFMNFSYY